MKAATRRRFSRIEERLIADKETSKKRAETISAQAVLDHEARMNELLATEAEAREKHETAQTLQMNVVAASVSKLQKDSAQTALAITALSVFNAMAIWLVASLEEKSLSDDMLWSTDGLLEFPLMPADAIATLVGLLVLIATINIAQAVRPSTYSSFKEEAEVVAWGDSLGTIANASAVAAGFLALASWTNPEIREQWGSGLAVTVLAALCVTLASYVRTWNDSIVHQGRQLVQLETDLARLEDQLKSWPAVDRKPSRTDVFRSNLARTLLPAIGPTEVLVIWQISQRASFVNVLATGAVSLATFLGS